MVPLVESLMDKWANSSFTRRASMVYTPAPSQMKQISNFKIKKMAQTDSTKKQRRAGELGSDDFSVLSSKSLEKESVRNDKSEIVFLQNQIDELKMKLVEKEEAQKLAENLVNEVNANNALLGELRRQAYEKDAMIKSTSTQLHNAKIKLADKEAALEKSHWEAQMFNKKVEKLQGDVVSSELEVSALMQLFEVLAVSDSFVSAEGDIAYFEPLLNLNPSKHGNISNFKIKKMAQTDSTKKQRRAAELGSDDFSVLSSKSLDKESVRNDKSEIVFLQNQIDELKMKLVEKEEALKLAENLVNEIKLADKEAALEKSQWEAQMFNKKVEKLQGDVVSSELEVSALMQLFEVLAVSDSLVSAEGDIAYFEPLLNLNPSKHGNVPSIANLECLLLELFELGERIKALIQPPTLVKRKIKEGDPEV
ncbi:hypothetical protein AXF42_Ash002199 [Apostasia shenzhenica]|uniref:Uncharacterized protein n=1 Tax=Apostasia shenzhenica TaxID=1088818 RepID=A0A2I0AN60_9ASPA|nr:hypothetical protein AXF42_Ash002199 [Apostasia shenzhenica]